MRRILPEKVAGVIYSRKSRFDVPGNGFNRLVNIPSLLEPVESDGVNLSRAWNRMKGAVKKPWLAPVVGCAGGVGVAAVLKAAQGGLYFITVIDPTPEGRSFQRYKIW
ncbi:hypothetical protein J2Z49_002288 [Desulfofundulus luciae]|uniref:Uncharacterized protein n=1 Tax=Desulfofundulus luciae TaxID=74702 RepID=A0ABU0B4E2_9FIRM|nr:hypothetical protein [Desulfofundulus luciae]MDQ0287169.1 hypothetical protein [Desulfofundulus luciae]